MLFLTILNSISFQVFATEKNKQKEKKHRPSFNLGLEVFLGASFTLGYQFKYEQSYEAYLETQPLRSSSCGGSIFTNPSISTANRNGWITGLRWRRFIGESFNIALGPYFRREFLSCYSLNNDNNDHNEFIEIDDYNLGISVSVGHRWRWDNFYLGFEWIGGGYDFSLPRLSSSKANKSFSYRLILLRFALGVSV